MKANDNRGRFPPSPLNGRRRKAIEAQQQPEIPNDWQLAADPTAAPRRLADLHQRRLVAEFVIFS